MTQPGEQLRDERQSARGWPRILFVVLACLACIFLWRGIIASTDAFLHGFVAEGFLTLTAAVTWTMGAVGIVHNGRRMRRIAYLAWMLNVLAPFVALAVSSWQLDRVNPWYHGGATYFFLPTVGAVAALVWLAWSDPSKIATRNGG
ncbi:MAG: hypothetical protein Q3979_06685 [Actinomycetaceae bacterium]|nr:hypothetical protein [Actinomycetaceae bacterium]